MKVAPGLIVLCVLSTAAWSAQTADSATEAQRWVAAKFKAVDEPPAGGRAFMSVAPNAGILLRDRIQERPLAIAARRFEHGLAMRAPGEITVELPAAAQQFSATIGVDSNDVGYYSNAGRGSVVASVQAGGRELYRSPVLREGMEGIPVLVDLGGAHEFKLRLEAVGKREPLDLPEWDQLDWADAKASLADRRTLALSDLPVGPVEERFTLEPPFSFVYAGRPSASLLKEWPVERTTRNLDSRRTEYTEIYRDHQTHLAVRCVAVAYSDFPIVEWTVYFKNDGTERSPILEDIKALETEFSEGAAEQEIVLHHSRGSSNSRWDYQPLETVLPKSSQNRFASSGGRPTDGDMPYFNLAWPGRGVIFCLGWPGQWSLTMTRTGSPQVHVSGGQELTHFWLAPGEEVRTPLAVVQFWNGDWIDGQNIWRRWMVEHNLPRTDGRVPSPMLSASSSRFTIEMQRATEANQKEYIEEVLAAKIPIDNWWMDAGWYPFAKDWQQTGTWEPDPCRFPRGLAPISEFAHSKGLKTIVWFEPERVTRDSWLAKNHPEWLLGDPAKDRLLFLGNPQAREWLTDHVSELIAKEGIDVYRQDFNFPPLTIWRAHDTPDRQGITEIEDVEGYLAYFDALLRRFPNLLIDTCASGGRRNDLETLRRAVPLWRSDHPFEPKSQQGETYGLALWVPYFGTAVNAVDKYSFRSQMTSALLLGISLEAIQDHREELLQRISQWREVAPYLLDNFFPLIPYSQDPTAWMALQFNATDGQSGVVEVFRHESSPFTHAVLKLRGLESNGTYAVRDLDSPVETQLTGRELMETGLPVTLTSAPGSVLISYKTTMALKGSQTPNAVRAGIF